MTFSSGVTDPAGRRAGNGARKLEASDAFEQSKILVVGPSLDIIGGQSVQAARLIERLGAVPGVTVDFLAVNPRLPGPLSFLQRIRYLRTLVTSAAYLASLLRHVRGYDVIHAYSASYWSYLLAPLPALAIGKAFGKRTVLNYHSGEADDHLRRWPRSARSMRMADIIVVQSEYLVDVFHQHGLKSQAIFNHIETDRLPYRPRRHPRPVFLSNRNMEAHYDVGSTIRAFALVQTEVPYAQLVVAGDGPQRPRLEEMAMDLRLRNVEFIGRVAPEQIGSLYDRCDIFLNSSRIDNMPLSILEAYAAGLPVVTSDAGGIPYIVRNGETGLMVPCGDTAAMAAAALRLLREPGLAWRLTSAARAECLNRYVWSAVEEDWIALYRGSPHAAPERPDLT